MEWIKLFINWVRVCVRLRSIAPWSVRFIDLGPLTKETRAAIEKVVAELGLESKAEGIKRK